MSSKDAFSTRNVIGTPVRSNLGEPVGRVEDIVYDRLSGRIAYAVISVEGVQNRLYAVPWDALQADSAKRELVVAASREKLLKGPSFEPSNWPDLENRNWGTQVYSYYGYAPHWAVPAQRRPAIQDRPPRRKSSAAWMVYAAFLVVILAGIGYLIYTQGWSTTAQSVRDAAISVKETSENAATTTKVKTALALSKRISAFDINVDTQDGVVSLSGKVPTEQVKELAAAIAEDTSGVVEVRNHLIVDPGTRPDPEMETLATRVIDLEIRAEVQDLLRDSPEMTGSEIQVRVRNQSVTLEGTVRTAPQKSRAEQLALSNDRVKSVDNALTVVENFSF